MATFIITIKTRYIGDSKTINAASLTAAKAQATMAFNALSSSIGQITITNENGVKLSHKSIENSRGKWEDVIAVEAEPAAEKKAPQQAAPKKQTFVIKVSNANGWPLGSVTIEAVDLNEAIHTAELLQINNGWSREGMSILTEDLQLTVKCELARDGYHWVFQNTQDSLMFAAAEVAAEGAKNVSQKPGFAIVNKIPDRGNATLSSARWVKRVHTLLVGQDPECVIMLDGDIASRVEVSEKAGESVVSTISNEACNNSYLISNFAAIQVLRWWAGEEAQSVGFINTKNNHLIIVTESEARWLDEKFFPLTKTGRR